MYRGRVVSGGAGVVPVLASAAAPPPAATAPATAPATASSPAVTAPAAATAAAAAAAAALTPSSAAPESAEGRCGQGAGAGGKVPRLIIRLCRDAPPHSPMAVLLPVGLPIRGRIIVRIVRWGCLCSCTCSFLRRSGTTTSGGRSGGGRSGRGCGGGRGGGGPARRRDRRASRRHLRRGRGAPDTRRQVIVVGVVVAALPGSAPPAPRHKPFRHAPTQGIMRAAASALDL